RNLKDRYEDGIVSIPDMELFENLTLMGFNEFSSNIATALVCLATNKTYNFSKMIFVGMVKNVNNKISKFLMYLRFLMGDGSGTPTEPHHTPTPKVDTSHPTTSSITLPFISTAPIPPVTQIDTTPIRQYSRRARIAQSSALPTVTDEPASRVRDISEGEACPTESGFIADQDRATIAKSSTFPYDSAPRAHEEEILRLKERVKVLEDRDIVAAKHSGDDTPIKGRSINEGEAVAERISSDSEEIARVLTSVDATTVLAGRIDVPTNSGSIPTAGPLGKEVMVESDTLKKQKLQEQIDAQVARELEEQQEKEDMRMNEQIARDAESQQRRPMTKKQKREYYMAMIRNNLGCKVKDFKGSKEEAERLKRKGLNLEQEPVKKQKSSEEAPEMEKST
nr:synaptobrevin, longin-like domain protein [Tanacetum cinerariifolium]